MPTKNNDLRSFDVLKKAHMAIVTFVYFHRGGLLRAAAAAVVMLTAVSSFALERTKALSPDEASKSFTVADDLQWELVLSEPEIAQPVNLQFDERGRLWVVQYRQYPYVAGLKVLSKDNVWRVQYDGVPPAPPHHTPGRDKITIHEDTDGDGKFDKHKTFVEGLNLVSSVAPDKDGVWVLNPPYLLFYPDKNRDDIPDGDPEVHLSGFGLSDSHAVANSLTWGPDGWLYATQGSTVSAEIIRPGVDKEPVRTVGQMVWRYHPRKKIYEVFSEGGGNAFGVEIDAQGRIFSGHNGGDTRGFHYVQGAYMQKGFAKHGPLSNPYAFGYFPAMKHHAVPRFTHTFIINEGSNLPEQYQGKLFGVEPMQNQLVQSEITPHGSSRKTQDINRPITSNDIWFRPVDIKLGPDGGIYVADFQERHPSHREHYQEMITRDDGRIWRLMGKGAKPTKPVDLNNISSDGLITLLRNPNRTVRRLALRTIGFRQDVAQLPKLRAMLGENVGPLSLELLWAIYQLGGVDEATALAALDHANPYVRQWTIRLLADEREVSPDIAARLTKLAESEPNVEVRTQLACSARRLSPNAGLPIVNALLQRQEDTDDIYQPLLLWWAIEQHCGPAPEAVLNLFTSPDLWNARMAKTHIVSRLMRRFAATGARKDLLTCAKLLKLAPDEESKRRLLSGFEEAYAGRSLASLPNELAEGIRALGGGSLALRVRAGDAPAVQDALALLADSKSDAKLRLELVQVFGQVQQPESVDSLLKVAETAGDEMLQAAAVAAVQTYSDERIGNSVLRLFEKGLPPRAGEAAQTLLVSRPAWARLLLARVDVGKIPTAALTSASLRKILLHNDPKLTKLVEKHWGKVEGATTEEMQQEVTRLLAVVKNGTGDPFKGRARYANVCGKCHQLWGEGGQIGPDLTPYQRDKIDALLTNIVNPSAEIREGFETYIVFTEDGRVLTGFLADQDNQVVVLRGEDGQSQSLERSSIEEMKPAPRSLMPEKLLNGMTEQEVRDLVAYLRSRQPLVQ